MAQGPDPGEVRWQFESDAQSALRARRLVESSLTGWGKDDLVDIAVLLANEVVTNAILHARTEIELVMRMDAGALRFEVHDNSSRPPRYHRAPLEAEGGRGLELVDTLADAWGVDESTKGKSVWFEIRLGERAAT